MCRPGDLRTGQRLAASGYSAIIIVAGASAGTAARSAGRSAAAAIKRATLARNLKAPPQRRRDWR